jgi:hypothetical protein
MARNCHCPNGFARLPRARDGVMALIFLDFTLTAG